MPAFTRAVPGRGVASRRTAPRGGRRDRRAPCRVVVSLRGKSPRVRTSDDGANARGRCMHSRGAARRRRTGHERRCEPAAPRSSVAFYSAMPSLPHSFPSPNGRVAARVAAWTRRFPASAAALTRAVPAGRWSPVVCRPFTIRAPVSPVNFSTLTHALGKEECRLLQHKCFLAPVGSSRAT